MISQFIYACENQDEKFHKAIDHHLVVGVFVSEDGKWGQIALTTDLEIDPVRYFSVTNFDLETLSDGQFQMTPRPSVPLVVAELPRFDKIDDKIILGHRYVPTLYPKDGKWHLSWADHESGDRLFDYEADNIQEVVWRADKEIKDVVNGLLNN